MSRILLTLLIVGVGIRPEARAADDGGITWDKPANGLRLTLGLETDSGDFVWMITLQNTSPMPIAILVPAGSNLKIRAFDPIGTECIVKTTDADVKQTIQLAPGASKRFRAPNMTYDCSGLSLNLRRFIHLGGRFDATYEVRGQKQLWVGVLEAHYVPSGQE